MKRQSHLDQSSPGTSIGKANHTVQPKEVY